MLNDYARPNKTNSGQFATALGDRDFFVRDRRVLVVVGHQNDFIARGLGEEDVGRSVYERRRSVAKNFIHASVAGCKSTTQSHHLADKHEFNSC